MKRKLLFFITSILLTANAWGQKVGDDFSDSGIKCKITSLSPATVEVTGRYIYSDSLSIPSTVSYLDSSYSVTTIGYYAFFSNDGLKTITIPQSVTVIDDKAFYLCKDLTSVSIPMSVTVIGGEAFSGCRSLSSITIPESVTTIGAGVFLNSGLAYVSIPSSVMSISVKAFSGCRSLASITIPESVMDIGNNAFSGCIGLTSITIPSSVTIIGNGAFTDCVSLTSATMSESMTVIGDSVFAGCLELTSFIIPESVEIIGHGIFDGCSLLTSLICKSSNPSIAIRNTFEYFSTNNCSLCIPLGASDVYRTDSNWQGFKEIVELDLTKKTDLYSILPRYTDGLPQDSTDIYTVNVAPNTPWTASSDQSWLTVTQSTLAGPGTISISALPNTTNAPRTATITVRTASETDSILVTLKSMGTDGVITITVVQPGIAATATADPEIIAIPVILYPNPARAGFIIDATSTCIVEICTQSGSFVKRIELSDAGITRIDDLKPGMYFVTIRIATEVKSHKMVIE